MPAYQREYFKKSIGKKPWFFCFRYGKQKYVRSGFMTKSEAQMAEERLRKTVILENKPTTTSVKVSLRDLLQGFFKNRAITNVPGTVAREKRLICSFLQETGSTTISRISISDIHWHIQQRKKAGISNRTINLELNLLRCIFKYAIEIGAAIQNPAKEIKNLKVVKKETAFPTHEEFLRFISAAGESPHGKQLVAWIWFRVYTGTRPTESFFVEWKDIDFEANVIRIIPKEGNLLKNARRREINMGPDIRQILLDWRQEWQKVFADKVKPHDWVFFHPSQKHKQARGFKHAFTKARENAGIPYLTSHGLRHYFISHAIMSGSSKDAIMRWVGHASTQMIEQTYGHLLRTYQEQEMRKFSFFHPANNPNPEGIVVQSAGNSQPQVASGSPEEAPKEKKGLENKDANIA